MSQTVLNMSAYNDPNFAKLLETHLKKSNTDNINSANTIHDDDFYAKLVALKTEQKKTLLFLEELYNTKQEIKKEISKSQVTLENINIPSSNSNQQINDQEYNYKLNTVSAYGVDTGLSEKYPIKTVTIGGVTTEGEMKQGTTSKPPPFPVRSSVTFQKENQVEDVAKKINDDLDEGIRKIEAMWDNFSLKSDNKHMPTLDTLRSIDFNSKFEKKPKRVENNNLRRSFSSSVVTKKKKPSIEIEWVPRVTIPQPFSMTIREQIKFDQRQESVVAEMRQERERRLEAELEECRKKFKARPVPRHVKENLYERKQLEEAMKKEKAKIVREISERGAARVLAREAEFIEKKKETDKGDFSAQPLPRFYFNEPTDEERKEEGVYKQITRQMRALEMLKASRLPNNMSLMEEKKMLEMERNEVFMAEMERLHREMNDKQLQLERLRKNHDVPDHDEAYRSFTVQLERHKAANRKNTRTVPFTLRSGSRSRCRDDCAAKDEELDKSRGLNRSSSSMSRLNGSMSASMDGLPIKTTEAQRLRESVTRGRLSEIARREAQKEHIEKMKALRQKKIQEKIREKGGRSVKEVEKEMERKARQLRLEQKRREEEYEEELAEINRKVGDRSLQIERADLENKRRALEKKYKDVLRRAGIDDVDYFEDEVKVARPVTSESVSGNNPGADEWVNEP